MYVTKVDDSFENAITVNDGEYDKFLSKEEVMHNPPLIESDKRISKDLFDFLHHGKK